MLLPLFIFGEILLLSLSLTLTILFLFKFKNLVIISFVLSLLAKSKGVFPYRFFTFNPVEFFSKI